MSLLMTPNFFLFFSFSFSSVSIAISCLIRYILADSGSDALPSVFGRSFIDIDWPVNAPGY